LAPVFCRRLGIEDPRALVAQRGYRECHLDGRPDQGDAQDRRKFAKREAQPDGEEQQRHASLGEQLDIFDLSI
jgi:hypothetical protein